RKRSSPSGSNRDHSAHSGASAQRASRMPSFQRKTNSAPSDHQRPRTPASSGGAPASGVHAAASGGYRSRTLSISAIESSDGLSVSPFVSTAAPSFSSREARTFAR